MSDLTTESGQLVGSEQAEQAVQPSRKALKRAKNTLMWAAKSWFTVAAIGMWMFVAYILAFYAGAIIAGNIEAWNNVLPKGYVPGDTLGNIAIGAHVLIAAIIIGGGTLQLIPKVRQVAPKFHRILGRIYIPAAMLTSIAGLYMVWIRGGGVGDLTQHISISLDAVLIILFGFLTIKYAMARQIATHRKWALRLFMVVNGVFFFRIGLMFWLTVMGPVGIEMKSFTGPFLDVWGFAQYLLPLAVLEMYFRASEGKAIIKQYITSAVIFILTICTGVGIAVAAMGMWLPRI